MTSPPASVRAASPADLDAVVRLNSVVQRLHFEALPDLFKPPGPEQREALAAMLSDPENAVLLAEVDGEAAGYVLLRILSAPESAFCHLLRWAELDHIAVLPAFEGRGIGRLLIQEARRWSLARGYSSLQLSVYAFNQRAVGFFAREGFTPLKHRLTLE